MRQLNGVYTQLFNKAHSRAGHLFQGRYKAILGEEAFGEKRADRLRSQRCAHRPGLEKLVTASVMKDREQRDRKIAEAVEKYGYTQRAIADNLDMHFTCISQIMNRRIYTVEA